MKDWHSFPVRVYFEDTDAQGVVYFANYLKFMERGRTEYLRSLGIEQDRLLTDQGLGFTLTENDARFLHPARYNDQLDVRTQLSGHGRARIELDQAVWRDEQLLCSARCVAACIEIGSFRPRRIPENIMAAVADAAAASRRT